MLLPYLHTYIWTLVFSRLSFFFHIFFFLSFRSRSSSLYYYPLSKKRPPARSPLFQDLDHLSFVSSFFPFWTLLGALPFPLPLPL
ncbi:hypothetical protein F5H01DRAFT_333077, partial [Linnemannia elongata]